MAYLEDSLLEKLAEGTRVTATGQESERKLSWGVVALAVSGPVLVTIFMALGFTMDLGALPSLAFGAWFMISLCMGIRIISSMWGLGPETPEWSKNERSLAILGTAVGFGGGAVGSFLGFLMFWSGIILVLLPEGMKRRRPPVGQTAS